ncbi:MAG: phosphotransferase, partial [Chloroflexota bacterium]|nr:phosphotransferase [Chloroflexota bacterium]
MSEPVPETVPLAGLVSTVTRIGSEVRRGIRPASPAVRALLVYLERAGFDGAPSFFGIDKHGRATPGTVPDAMLPAIGRLIWRYHDAVADFTLPSDLHWHAAAETTVPGRAIVCHNDISSRTIVFRDGQPVALIDWDMAYLAPPVWDVAHAVWQFALVLADGDFTASGWRNAPLLSSQMERMRLLIDGYGLGSAERAGLRWSWRSGSRPPPLG